MNDLVEKAQFYLDVLCRQISTRQVGSVGNRKAADFFAETAMNFGFLIEKQPFECVDWASTGATCEAGDVQFRVHSSPYSLGCDVTAVLKQASTMEELEHAICPGEILLLRGELSREQLMPKNFPFYNPNEHKRIVSWLEEKQPAALICATNRNPELAGAVYPFPLIEDGDFDIPSVFTTEEEGTKIYRHLGRPVHLVSRAQRIPSNGWNVLAWQNPGAGKKIVVCAHIDAKIGTPGAVDNAAGIVTLLLVAELLKGHSPKKEIELLAMNGEDYYGANGEKAYLAANQDAMKNINLVINLDGLGYIRGRTAFSFYNLEETVASRIRVTLESHTEIFEGESWFQSDHMVFVMNNIPAVAVTTEHFMEMESTLAHTAKDTPEMVNAEKLADTAIALSEIIINQAGKA